MGYSMAKIAHFSDAFTEVFEHKASPVEGQSLKQKDWERRKGKGKKKRKNNKKIKDIACPRKKCYKFKYNADGKKGLLSYCKCFWSRLELISPISSQKIFKSSKKYILGKKL